MRLGASNGLNLILVLIPCIAAPAVAAPATQPYVSPRLATATPLMPDVSVRAHAKSVTAIQFLPDGKRAITLGLDHIARLWDVATGAKLLEYPFAPAVVSQLAISHDGKRFAVGGKDK